MNTSPSPPYSLPRIRKVRVKFSIDEDLNAQLDHIFFDPMKRKVAFGAKGELVNSLIRKWVEERREAGFPILKIEGTNI